MLASILQQRDVVTHYYKTFVEINLAAKGKRGVGGDGGGGGGGGGEGVDGGGGDDPSAATLRDSDFEEQASLLRLLNGCCEGGNTFTEVQVRSIFPPADALNVMSSTQSLGLWELADALTSIVTTIFLKTEPMRSYFCRTKPAADLLVLTRAAFDDFVHDHAVAALEDPSAEDPAARRKYVCRTLTDAVTSLFEGLPCKIKELATSGHKGWTGEELGALIKSLVAMISLCRRLEADEKERVQARKRAATTESSLGSGAPHDDRYDDRSTSQESKASSFGRTSSATTLYGTPTSNDQELLLGHRRDVGQLFLVLKLILERSKVRGGWGALRVATPTTHTHALSLTLTLTLPLPLTHTHTHLTSPSTPLIANARQALSVHDENEGVVLDNETQGTIRRLLLPMSDYLPEAWSGLSLGLSQGYSRADSDFDLLDGLDSSPGLTSLPTWKDNLTPNFRLSVGNH